MSRPAEQDAEHVIFFTHHVLTEEDMQLPNMNFTRAMENNVLKPINLDFIKNAIYIVGTPSTWGCS